MSDGAESAQTPADGSEIPSSSNAGEMGDQGVNDLNGLATQRDSGTNSTMGACEGNVFDSDREKEPGDQTSPKDKSDERTGKELASPWPGEKPELKDDPGVTDPTLIKFTGPPASFGSQYKNQKLGPSRLIEWLDEVQERQIKRETYYVQYHLEPMRRYKQREQEILERSRKFFNQAARMK